MGQVHLRHLEDAATAVVRFIRWHQELMNRGSAGVETRRGMLRYIRRLWNAHGDLEAIPVPRGFSAEFEGKPSDDYPYWSVRFWPDEERRHAENRAGWFYRSGKELDLPPEPKSVAERRAGLREFLEGAYGRELSAEEQTYVDEWQPPPELPEAFGIPRDGMFLEKGVTLGRDGRALRLEYDFDGIEAASFPRLLKEPPWPEGPQPDSQTRRDLQDLDEREHDVLVRVDPRWHDRWIRESVIAQTIQWLIRTSPHDEPLTADALDWYHRWCARAARRERSPELDSEANSVASRSVRPPSAAAHRAYVRESLRHRGQDRVREAAKHAGISRSTAYERMRRKNRRLQEFLETEDPVGQLANFLRDNEPNRRLATDSRTIVETLVEEGMQENSARRLERRTRQLEPDERARRIMRSIERTRSRGSHAAD